ncbi:putative HELICASE domain protein [Mycobacterium xenopi 4042]|uniref:Putative HELICASE domain protein n=1 Tax=Mycobacterium xenopi 4042 TaxID=1299334 RepID=X8BCD9_MYCXE|nr:putative HELICASE domain protein [Mycobacterium xenopi 4042]
MLIARDDPLDTYLVHHPAALLDKPIERVVIDPANPYLLGPQLLCAATELTLDDDEVRALRAEDVASTLVDDGLLRHRFGKYFPAPGLDPHPAVDIRGPPTARSSSWRPTPAAVGTASASQARRLCTRSGIPAPGRQLRRRLTRHRGRHRVCPRRRPRICHIRTGSHRHRGHRRRRAHGFRPVTLGLVPVTVTNQVIGYLRRRLNGEVLDFIDLDMPAHTLPTTAVMYTITPESLQRNGIDGPRIPGALHAAEHAAIGLLPLVASCDRATSAGCRPRWVPTRLPGCPLSLSTTAIRAGRLRRTRLSSGEDLAERDGRGDRGVRMPHRLPVVCAVAEMRKRQPTAGQSGCGRRVAVGARRIDRRMTTDPSTGDVRGHGGNTANALLTRPGRAELATRRDERSDNAIRSQSRRLRAQQQDTRPAHCAQLIDESRGPQTCLDELNGPIIVPAAVKSLAWAMTGCWWRHWAKNRSWWRRERSHATWCRLPPSCDATHISRPSERRLPSRFEPGEPGSKSKTRRLPD